MMPVAVKYGAKSYTNIDILIKKNIVNSKYLWKSFLQKYNPCINLLRISDYINILNKNNYFLKFTF